MHFIDTLHNCNSTETISSSIFEKKSLEYFGSFYILLHHNLLQNMVHRKLIKYYQDDRLWQGDEILCTVKVVTAKGRFLGFIEFTFRRI